MLPLSVVNAHVSETVGLSEDRFIFGNLEIQRSVTENYLTKRNATRTKGNFLCVNHTFRKFLLSEE